MARNMRSPGRKRQRTLGDVRFTPESEHCCPMGPSKLVLENPWKATFRSGNSLNFGNPSRGKGRRFNP
jgi:hypothetical protein